jgi:hypothetical protein
MKYLYLRGPFSRISLSTDADIPDDDDTEQRTVSGELGADGIFTIDLIRFRSWLTREVMRNDIFLKLGSREFTFATVYTRSLVAAFDVTADYENGLLTCLCDIVGKIMVKQDGTRGIILEATQNVYAKNQLDSRKGCKVEEFVNG